jgi:signal transduction histidine kinase
MELKYLLFAIFGLLMLIIVSVFFYWRFAFRAQNTRLQKVNQHLQEILQENYLSAKMLVQRDRELTQTNERLRDLDMIKSEFVSVAAHQLRTPLTGIKWTLHSLSEEEFGKLTTEQKKLVGDGLKATLRLIALINDLLDTARLEEGRFGFQFSQEPFDSLIEHVLQNYETAAKEKGVRLRLELPKTKLQLLRMDPEKISIILSNLVDNALKYTSPGGEVYLRVEKTPEYVILKVQDTGIGIPEDQAHRVFTKFFRAKNAQLAQTSGTGLGLYVASNIAREHGGRLSFESKEEKGSTFSLYLPLKFKEKKL